MIRLLGYVAEVRKYINRFLLFHEVQITVQPLNNKNSDITYQ